MLKKLSAAVGFALLAGSAQAATVTYVSSASLEAVEINQSLSLDLFDPFYYGTLTAVSLELRSEAQFAFSLTAELNSQFPGNEGDVNILTQGSIAFSSSLADLDGKLIFTHPFTMYAEKHLMYPTTTWADTLSDLNSDVLENSQLNDILSSFVWDGMGSRTFNIGCSSNATQTNINADFNFSITSSTVAGCAALLTYTYTPGQGSVPEPTSLALFGLGLAGLGAVRRKKPAA